MLISLERLIEIASEHTVTEAISRFSCSKDNDIESFLQEKAALFDRKGKSKTHFILSQEALKAGIVDIAAYFSLAIALLRIPEGTSATQIKRLDGLYSKRGGEQITEIPSFLIGQLAKNDSYSDAIPGTLVLECALSVISSAEEMVGGRVVYLECRDVSKVIGFYEKNGFKVFRRDPDDGLVQMCCVIGK